MRSMDNGGKIQKKSMMSASIQLSERPEICPFGVSSTGFIGFFSLGVLYHLCILEQALPVCCPREVRKTFREGIQTSLDRKRR